MQVLKVFRYNMLETSMSESQFKGKEASTFLEGNSTLPIPTVVPTGGINDAKCEMCLPSVLVTLSDLGVTATSARAGRSAPSGA